jgi:hypothetical protein
MPSAPKWTHREINRVVETVLAKGSLSNLASELGRTHGSIDFQIAQLRKAGRLPKAASLPWSAEAEAELITMVSGGWSAEMCAEAMKRGPLSVVAKIRSLRECGRLAEPEPEPPLVVVETLLPRRRMTERDLAIEAHRARARKLPVDLSMPPAVVRVYDRMKGVGQ